MGKQVFQISLFGILLFIANADIATAASGEPCQLDALIFRDIKSNFLNKKNIVSWPYPTESGPKCPAFGGEPKSYFNGVSLNDYFRTSEANNKFS